MADGIVQVDDDEGMSHVAVYTTNGEMVQVTYLGLHRTKFAQIGQSTPAALARLVLTEFVQEAEAEPLPGPMMG